MTDITSVCSFRTAVVGDLMVLSIVTPATAKSSDTIDLKSDTAKDVIMTEILNTVVQDDAGADKTSTWVPSTGIITLGTITTGIHNLLVFGK